MSGLGEAIDSGGISGTAETVPSQDAQTLQSQPSEIKHTSAIETLNFLLFRDWIFLTRFVISSKFQPGHVFGIIKVHPLFCHKFVRFVYQMFNAWNGSMGIRCRFMATAFFGGSFRVGFLPPNISESEIRGMGTENLTAYPNVDLDPKNTDWMTYSPPDERNVMFHWSTNTPDYTKPESFGGYIVFYVVGPLVTQNATFDSISLVVESVGKFQFAQPNPSFGISIAPPINSGPLSVATCTDILNQRGCDDQVSSRMRIQYLNSGVTSLSVGGMMAKGINGIYTSSFPGQTLDSAMLTLRNGIEANTTHLGLAQFSLTNSDSLTYLDMSLFPGRHQNIIQNSEINAYEATANLFSGASLPEMKIVNSTTSKKFDAGEFKVFFQPINGGTYFVSYPADAGHSCYLVVAGETSAPLSLAALTITGNSTSLTPTVANESIVTFTNVGTRSLNIQTEDMAFDMNATSGLDPAVSYLYAVRTKAFPDPIRILRLNPNGFLTTQPFASDVIFDGSGSEIYLTYEGTFPTSSPLPPTSSMSYMYHTQLHNDMLSKYGKTSRRTRIEPSDAGKILMLENTISDLVKRVGIIEKPATDCAL